MSLWQCPSCGTLTGPNPSPCPKCGQPTQYYNPELAARSSGATALDELLTPVKLTGLIYDYQGTRRLSDIHADLVALLSPWAEQQQAQIQTLTREVERLQAEATEFSNRPAVAQSHRIGKSSGSRGLATCGRTQTIRRSG